MHKDWYWLNSDSRLFLERGYLSKGESADDRYVDIAKNAEKLLGIDGFAEKFLGYLAKGYYSLSTPVITNFGKDRGLPVSCFNSHVSDTMESILTKAAEVGIMSKGGGGTSAFFGDLRPRGAKISVGGESSGPTHFMEIFDSVTEVVSQSNVRRGSLAAYLPVEHEDIEEFLKIRSEGHAIQNMSIGVTITDKWMKDMIDGNKENRKIWGQIIKKRFETGYPYIQFTDTVNNNAPQVYKDKGLKIKSSNLCVSGETLILTKDGYKVIKDLTGKDIEIWNGDEWSLSRCEKTGENQKLIKVVLDSGHNLDCTEYHKFYVDQNDWSTGASPSGEFYMKSSSEIETRAIDLKVGDRIKVVSSGYIDRYMNSISKVNCIIDTNRYDDTYCVNEPLRHKAVFNGVLTGQCSEIELLSDDKNSFVCVLSSLNLLHWDEIKDTDAIETLIYFLDSVNKEFVRKTENMKFMETAHHFAKTQRALGMGALGWHSFLQSKMIPFESFEAKMLNNSIWKTIQEKSDAATKQLAEMFGEPELLKGYGIRNVCRLAVAPTTSCTTEDTKFHLGDGTTVDYHEYCHLGGLNLEEIMSIELIGDDDKLLKVKWNDKILINRDGIDMEVFGYEILVNDDFLDFL